MNKKFTVELCSDSKYEKMVADISWGNDRVAMVTQENGIDKMEIEMFSPPEGTASWKFSVEDFMKAVQLAKTRLPD